MVDTVTWRLKNWYINFPGGFLEPVFDEKSSFRNEVFCLFEIPHGGTRGLHGSQKINDFLYGNLL